MRGLSGGVGEFICERELGWMLGSVAQAGRTDVAIPAGRGAGPFLLRLWRAEDEFVDLWSAFVHGGEGGAEEAVKGLLIEDAGGKGGGDAIEHLTVVEVEVEGTQALAVVEAGKEFGAGASLGGWDFD